jgi:hypothetical protein
MAGLVQAGYLTSSVLCIGWRNTAGLVEVILLIHSLKGHYLDWARK